MRRATQGRSEEGVFTRYLRGLDARGKPPDEDSFDTVWQVLRRALRRELRQRGLWRLPPSYLGVLGHERWSAQAERARHDWDALDELVAELYEFVFVDRMAALRAQLRLKPNVDGLVFLNVGHFVHERQREHDPFGARVFAIFRNAALAAVDDGELFVVDGDAGVKGGTVLAFAPEADPTTAADAPALRPLVADWCDELLPDLVTTRGKGHHKLEAAVRARVLGLERQGIEAFVFTAVADLVKADGRRRWAAVFEQTEGEKGVEELAEEGELARVVALVRPDTELEDHQSFVRLVDCVGRELAALRRGRSGKEARRLDETTAAQLRALWEALVSWATGGGAEARPDPDSPPSQRQMARSLGISRDRLPRLYEMLGDVVRSCRAAIRFPTVSGPVMAMREKATEPSERRAQLRRATGEAVARAVRAEEASRPQTPGPGDVYLLRASAGQPVEWVVLGDAPNGGVVAVPADTNPLAGAADVAVPRDAPAGPLTLRCRHVRTLPAALFEPELRTRSLERTFVEQAREAKADREPEDVDRDPDYQEWMDEVAAAVRAVDAVAEGLIPFPARRRQTPQRRWTELLAAVLAAFVVGLSTLVVAQWRELRRGEEPYLDPHVEEVHFDERADTETWRLSAGDRQLLVTFIFERLPADCERLRIELRGDDLAWSSGALGIPATGEYRLVLPRRFVDRGLESFRLMGLCDGEWRLLEERPVRIEKKR